MRILVLNFEYPPLGGGASPVSKTIAEKLAQKEHQITVVTMGLEGLPSKQESKNIIVHRINCGRKKANMSYPLEHLRFLRNAKIFLKRHLSNHTYELVHCHFILSTGILARWLKRSYGLPYIITSHGSDLPGFNPDRFQAIHKISPFFIRRILNDCSAVVSPSNFLSKLILPFLREKNKLHLIPNGIPATDQSSEKKDIILSTGRLLERKGFHILVGAGRKYKLPFEIHICGDGPMLENLRRLAQNSASKIVFHGWLDNTSEEYKRLLAEARIYVLISRFENASISLLEAMANSCAVITSNTSGCPETVGEAGICIPPDDIDELGKTLKQLCGNHEKIKELGQKAVERAQSKFSWDRIAEQYEEILKSNTKDE